MNGDAGLSRRTFLGASLALSLTPGACASLPPAQEATSGGAQDPGADPIERSRRAALAVLKPSEKDLDHGLELHRSSVVFDAYGFSPRAGGDADALERAAKAGASDAELDDLAEESAMIRCVTDREERDEYKAAWEAAGVTCIFQNAGEEGQDPLRLIKRLARFTHVTDRLSEFVAKATTADDVLAAKKQGRRALVFTTNGVPLTQQFVSTRDELRFVRVFYQLGVRMMHMTYNRRNLLGDGCAEPADAGLSEFGREAVAELNRLGVIPDVAHSGYRTSAETAKASNKPVVASHTACAALHKHMRGKPDDVIRAVADSGGYVGICCIPQFLGGAGDIAAMMRHIAHVAQRFGADHVAIGTDVAHSSRVAAARAAKLPRRATPRYEALWPPDPFVATPEAKASLAWTNWPLFTVGMVQQGLRDEDIQKILGGNVLRVLRASSA